MGRDSAKPPLRDRRPRLHLTPEPFEKPKATTQCDNCQLSFGVDASCDRDRRNANYEDSETEIARLYLVIALLSFARSRPTMPAHRLSQLQKNCDRLRDQLVHKQGILATIAPEEQARIRQQIEDLKEQVAECDREYWCAIGEEANSWAIVEEEAQPVVAEIVKGIGQLETDAAPTEVSTEMLAILNEIRDKLNKPGMTAAAKLKGAISTIPPFVGLTYEAELDTERFFQRHFPTFCKLLRRQAKK